MKRYWCFSLLFIFFSSALFAQKIRYSKENAETPLLVGMHLVPNVEGSHHLVCFSEKQKHYIYIFDPQLRFSGKKELDINLKEISDARILPFQKAYFLSYFSKKTKGYELLKIDAQGNISSYTERLQKLLDSEVKNNVATVELVMNGNDLNILAFNYSLQLGSIISTVLQVNGQLGLIKSRRALFNYNRNEVLQQIQLVADGLLVLKTARTEADGNILDVMKVNLDSSETLVKTYKANSFRYSNPEFIYNPLDSSLLVFSRIGGTIFMSRLDHLLNEKAPLKILKSQFGNKILANFLLVEGQKQHWLSMSLHPRRGLNTFQDPRRLGVTLPTFPWQSTRYAPSSFYSGEEEKSEKLRFTILNDTLQIRTDTLLAGKTKLNEINPFNSSMFTLHNKSFLLFSQKFNSRQIGLVLISTTKTGELTISDLPVYGKYDYNLPLLQPVKEGYFLLPYAHKKEIGLVKVELEDELGQRF